MYPLTLPGLVFGAAIGGIVAFLTGSLLNGIALAVPLLVMGLTWRKQEVPVLPFILGYQWISIVIAHFYEQIFGERLLLVYAPGDVERTMLVSLAGLVVLAVGMRVGAGSAPVVESEAHSELSVQGLRALFWLVILLHLPEYISALNPRQYLGYGAMADVVIGLRRLFVLALWYEVVRRRGPFSYLILSFLCVLVPALGAYFATFKEPAFMLLLVVVSAWRPWDRAWWRTAAPRLAALAPIIFLMLVLATAWQYGVKKETREAHDRDAIGARPGDRAAFFVDRTRNVLPELWASPRDGLDSLVGRLSYVVFFSRVLEYVPSVEPHADGELLWMAITNGFVPRLLFPDKPQLPSDSYYTNRFTGLRVASGAISISIGYMAEFYADWGMTGMYLSILGYGLWMGIIHRGVRRFVRPAILVAPALVTVLMAMVEFEHQFIKGFAALNLGFAVVVFATTVLRPWLYRVLANVPEPLAESGYPRAADDVRQVIPRASPIP